MLTTIEPSKHRPELSYDAYEYTVHSPPSKQFWAHCSSVGQFWWPACRCTLRPWFAGKDSRESCTCVWGLGHHTSKMRLCVLTGAVIQDQALELVHAKQHSRNHYYYYCQNNFIVRPVCTGAQPHLRHDRDPGRQTNIRPVAHPNSRQRKITRLVSVQSLLLCYVFHFRGSQGVVPTAAADVAIDCVLSRYEPLWSPFKAANAVLC